MTGETDIVLYGVDATKVRYVTGCTREFGEKMRPFVTVTIIVWSVKCAAFKLTMR